MSKVFVGVVIIGALVWAQTTEIIPPKQAGTAETDLCCGRRMRPPEPKPEKIEPEMNEAKLSEGWAFLVLGSEDPLAMNEIFSKLEKKGINTNGLRWPPHCAMIKATKEDEEKIRSVERVEAVYYGIIDRSNVPYADDITTGAIEYWNKMIRGEFDESTPVPGLEPPKNDMLIPPNNYRYQSDYMFGSIAACIFFPESNGAVNTENWTTSLRNNVVSEVQAGCQRWVNWASSEVPPITLSFTVYYYDYTQLPTDCEPITLNSYNDEYQWIQDCMDDIGMAPNANYFQWVSDFNDWLKSNYGTDWAHSIFVANSYNDVDGLFADGYAAYAYFGGPFLQMTYDNGNYTINNMDWVHAHEAGHNFYAFDEYSSSGCNCNDSRNGYQNQNCANGCTSNVTCVMRNALETPVEYYSKGHVGWDPGVYTLSDDVTQSLGYPYPKARKYQYSQSSIYWAVTGVRPGSGSDWDISLYADNTFGSLLASSASGSTTVDFVVADYNHSPTGTDGIYASRYSGTSGATIEWDDAAESFSYPNSYSASWPGGDVVEMIDYNLTSPANLTFTLDITSGSADLGFGIFNSSGATYYAGRSGMLASADANGSGADEAFDVNLTSSDWYGIVVWANNTSNCQFTIYAGPVGIAENNMKAPGQGSFLNARPNPCKGFLNIDYTIGPGSRDAVIKIFDVSGKLAKTYQVSAQQGSVQSVVWDCQDSNGTMVPDGIYFICLEGKDFKAISKIALLK